MPEGQQLAVLGEPLQRLALQDSVVVGYVVEYRWLEHEEAAVDPSLVGLRLLGKTGHGIPIQSKPAKARRGAHGSNGRYPAV